MPLEVICVGFGRTGTNSLQVALNKLGFPCHHMKEVAQDRSAPEPFIAAELGELVDWDSVFVNYKAVADWPSVRFWEQLIKKYPNAKVILTTRDPESWYKSYSETIFTVLKFIDSPYNFTNIFPLAKKKNQMLKAIIMKGEFENRISDKNFLIEKFNQHNEKVKKVVEPDRLLVYQVKEGWDPLCKFLGVPVPNEPFPNINDTAQFRKRQRLRYTRLTLLAIPLSIWVAIMAVIIARRFQLFSIVS